MKINPDPVNCAKCSICDISVQETKENGTWMYLGTIGEKTFYICKSCYLGFQDICRSYEPSIDVGYVEQAEQKD